MAKQLRVGIVGTRRGQVFLGALAGRPECQVVGLADRDPARLAEAMRLCPQARGYAELDVLLAEERPDIVIVATDAPSHRDHALQSMEAGADVLSEVPAAFTAQQHLDIVEAAARTGRRYSMAENCVHWGFIQTWQRMVAAGQLGEIAYAEAEYLHSLPDRHYVDAEGRYHTHEEAAADSTIHAVWRARFHPIQYLTHSLGPILWITGDRCVSVSCLATPAWRDPMCASPDLEAALFHTAAGRIIRIVCGFNVAYPAGHRFSLMGTKGTVKWDSFGESQPRMWLEGNNLTGWATVPWSTERVDGPEEARRSGHGGADWYVAQEFVAALARGDAPPLDVHRSMDMSLPGACAAISAERGGEAIPIPDTRDPAQVAAWLARGYTEPWPIGRQERAGW